MGSNDHVGLGVSYAGFGGPAPPRSPKLPKLPSARIPRLAGRREIINSNMRRPSRFNRLCRSSIWLCLLVLAVSIGLKYVCDKKPSLPNLVTKRVKDYFPNALKELVNGIKKEGTTFSYPLLWMAPFLSGGGYCSEALSFVEALDSSKVVNSLTISHHGDAENVDFWKGLPPTPRQTLMSLFLKDIKLADSVVVCHSEPGAWYPPLFQTVPCPPTGYKEPRYIIGRTMFETNSVNPDHVERCNKMDEIWVPTEFHVETFTEAGVNPDKLIKVVQAVDTHFFDPAKAQPLKLNDSKMVFYPYNDVPHSSPPFVFLSIFKWEHRKGWDVLLSAFLQEFSVDDNVVLYLVTNPYHTNDDFALVMRKFVISLELQEPNSGWPRVYVIDEHVPQALLPGLYKAADCFVLPSRGEGWGRPIVEAMAMELPVIATNWSGMTEYMTHHNSYPLQTDGMSEIRDGPFKGHYWAEPSRSHLMALMRQVVKNPKSAVQKGKVARSDMLAKYSPEVVGQIVLGQLLRIQENLDSLRPSDA